MSNFVLYSFNKGDYSFGSIDFGTFSYENNFDFYTKLKYVSLYRHVEFIPLGDKYNNRAEVFVTPITRSKIFVYFKPSNLVKLFLMSFVYL